VFSFTNPEEGVYEKVEITISVEVFEASNR
jgi:hypothetical protein